MPGKRIIRRETGVCVERFRPYRDVDPEFADLLAAVREAGVGVHAVTTACDPPHYVLRNESLPITLS